MHRAVLRWSIQLTLVGAGLLGACGDSGNPENGGECPTGSESCSCTEGGACDSGLECDSGVCVEASDRGDGDGDGGDGDAGDGDGGDGDAGDGDVGGESGDGDGDAGDGDAMGGAGSSSGGNGGDGAGGAPGDGDAAGGSGGATCDASGRLNLPVTYRDFNVSHPDFYPAGDATCNGRVTGMAATLLDEEGNPVFGGAANACTNAARFGNWFKDSLASSTIEETLVLFPDGQGGHATRHGPGGEQWEAPAEGMVSWCGNVGEVSGCQEGFDTGDCIIDYDPDIHECFETGDDGMTTVDGIRLPTFCCSNCFCAGEVTRKLLDGTPLFFPIDDHPDIQDDARYRAKIPSPYFLAAGWPWEGTNGGPLHNFHFTTELSIPFTYREGMVAEIMLVEDDDAFVFINGHLVVDLGGQHVPMGGTITFAADGNVETRIWNPEDPLEGPETTVSTTSTTVNALELQAGSEYEIKVFHAERKPAGSTFVLSLSGLGFAGPCTP